MPLKLIKVFGALIDYETNSVKLFQLIMDFENETSTVKVSSNSIPLPDLFWFLPARSTLKTIVYMYV